MHFQNKQNICDKNGINVNNYKWYMRLIMIFVPRKSYCKLDHNCYFEINNLFVVITS